MNSHTNAAAVIYARLKKGESTWKNPEAYRSSYFSIMERMVHRIALSRFSSEDRVLELGAGMTYRGNQSFLVSLLPEKFRKNVFSTDLNPQIVCAAQIMGFRQVIHLDATAISENFPENSCDKVIAANFLETLSPENLARALEQIKKVLKPGGLLIHVADMDPFLNEFISQNITEDTLSFQVSEPDVGMIVIKKSDYLKVRDQLVNQISKIEIQFLDWYANLSKLEKEYVIIRQKELNQFPLFEFWIKRIFPESVMTFVSRTKWYEERLKSGVEKSGMQLEVAHSFQDQEFRKKSEFLKSFENLKDQSEFKLHAERIIAAMNGGCNYFNNNQGDAILDFLTPVAKDMVCVVCKIHVLIAKKSNELLFPY